MWKKRIARAIELFLTVVDGILSNVSRLLMAMLVNVVFVFAAGSIFAAFIQKTDITSQEVQTALAGAAIAVAFAQTLLLWLMWDVVDLVDRKPWFEDQLPDALDELLEAAQAETPQNG